MGDPRPPVYPISQSPRSSRGQGYQLHPGLGDPTDKGCVRGAPGPRFVGATPGQEAPRYSRPSSTRKHCAQRLISLPHQSRPFPKGEGSGPRVSEEQNQPEPSLGADATRTLPTTGPPEEASSPGPGAHPSRWAPTRLTDAQLAAACLVAAVTCS